MKQQQGLLQADIASGAVPRLLPSLRMALASLYGLPLHGATPNNPKEAHDFLMQIQSRNIRRRIRSLQQRYTDTSSTTATNNSSNDKEETLINTEDADNGGSSWLACLALLCQTDRSHYCWHFTATERLFAAQTLLHRLRRVKLVEAVDIEIETSGATQCYHQNDSNHFDGSIPHHYQQWMQNNINPFIAQVLLALPADLSNDDGEQRLKAEMTILTLAATAYLQACESITSSPCYQKPTPLLSTTVSALVTAVFRLRYSNNTQQQTCMVAMIQHSFQLVWKVAADNANNNHQALSIVLLIAVGSIPDTILGSPGGARGRLSVDPRCLRAASHELRYSTTTLLVDILIQQQIHHSNNHTSIDLLVLQTCTQWAIFLPLSVPILEIAIPTVNQFLVALDASPQQRQAAFSFLLAVYESSSWSVDQILASIMGLTEQQQQSQQHAIKKKQSSRSKKRHKEMIDNNITDALLQEAHAEKQFRGQIAYQVTLQCWGALKAVAVEAISEAAIKNVEVEGEGSIGCVAACANACLPYILRYYSSSPHSNELFQNITEVFQQLSACPNAAVRALAFEPLYTLHTVLVDVVRTHGPLPNELEDFVVNHFFKSSLNMASFCGYPAHHFDDLGAESDHALEVERNDVRDLLRTVTASGESARTDDSEASSAIPLDVITRILANLLGACQEAVTSARQGEEGAFPEPAVHAFSSLAKPVNHLAKCYAKCGESDRVHSFHHTVLRILLEINQMTVHAFQHSLPLNQLLPLSRIVNIVNASFAPFLSALSSVQDETVADGLSQLLNVIIQGAILSLEQIPELSAPSILDHSMYDIRGTMRGPGGEDHVGCLTLMRLSFESDALAQRLAQALPPFISRLCELHQQLKNIEDNRGKMIYHGRGVTPQTRRILVGALCHLELVSPDKLGAYIVLEEIFNSAIDTVASYNGRPVLGEQDLFRIAEITLDLASFSPVIVAALFDSSSHVANGSSRTVCLEVLTFSCVIGYKRVSVSSEGKPDEAIIQWNRLRAALFLLLKTAAGSDLPDRGATIVCACVTAECEAIQRQIAAGPSSTSSIFTENIVSSESVPAGLFIRLITEIIQSFRFRKKENELLSLPSCLRALNATKEVVLSTITLSCPSPDDRAFVDPRPTLTEAWLQAMIEIAEAEIAGAETETLLTDSCFVVVSLLFYPTMGKTQQERMSAPGMSLDGPQSLTIMTFLGTFFRLGSSALQAAGERLLTTVPVDTKSVQEYCQFQNMQGVSVIGAALFRACQGSLPPWAIESIPDVFSCFFEACNNDVETFGLVIRLSMELRLLESAGFGSVAPTEVLAGRFIENMSEKAKSAFIEESKHLSRKGDGASWRRLKVLIKQACGGKKKDTDFGQKPALTRWEFARI